MERVLEPCVRNEQGSWFSMKYGRFALAALLFGLMAAPPRAAYAPVGAEASGLAPAGPEVASVVAAGTLLPFDHVWSLIQKYSARHASPFSPELVACLFWEESGFRMVSSPSSPAVGLGQVLPTTLTAVNRRFGTRFTPEQLVTSPDASVESAILVLKMAWDWKPDKTRALKLYAGSVKNLYPVEKWLAGEAAMMEGRHPMAAAGGWDWWTRKHRVRALEMCGQPGHDPETVLQ